VSPRPCSRLADDLALARLVIAATAVRMAFRSGR
jgi:hypothetical protein